MKESKCCMDDSPAQCRVCEDPSLEQEILKKETDRIIRECKAVGFDRQKTELILKIFSLPLILKRVREDEREKTDRITQIIQAKLDRNDSPSLKAGLLYALTIIEGQSINPHPMKKERLSEKCNLPPILEFEGFIVRPFEGLIYGKKILKVK